MIRPLILIATLALTGCIEVQEAATDAARTPAKRAVTEAIFTRFPQIPKELTEAAASCVIDNATDDDITALAGDAITGVTEKTATRVQSILTKPATSQCLLSAATARGVIL